MPHFTKPTLDGHITTDAVDSVATLTLLWESPHVTEQKVRVYIGTNYDVRGLCITINAYYTVGGHPAGDLYSSNAFSQDNTGDPSYVYFLGNTDKDTSELELFCGTFTQNTFNLSNTADVGNSQIRVSYQNLFFGELGPQFDPGSNGDGMGVLGKLYASGAVICGGIINTGGALNDGVVQASKGFASNVVTVPIVPASPFYTTLALEAGAGVDHVGALAIVQNSGMSGKLVIGNNGAQPGSIITVVCDPTVAATVNLYQADTTTAIGTSLTADEYVDLVFVVFGWYALRKGTRI